MSQSGIQNDNRGNFVMMATPTIRQQERRITTVEAQAIAKEVFGMWLRRQEDPKRPYQDEMALLVQNSVPCLDKAEVFTAEAPPRSSEKRFEPLGKDDPDFIEEYNEAVSYQNEAKSVCATCPIRKKCLYLSLLNKEEYGVWGGLEEASRKKIQNLVFKKLVKSFNSGELSEEFLAEVRSGEGYNFGI